MSLYARILVAVDGSPTSERGLREALSLAADQKATLVALHVINDFPLMIEMSSAVHFDESLRLMREQADKMLGDIGRRALEVGVTLQPAVAESVGKRVADVIIETAEQHRCQLIVMGTHGRRGFNRLTLGSDAELVLRGSKVPLLLVRSGGTGI